MPAITDGFMKDMISRTKTYSVVLLKRTPKRDAPEANAIVWEHGRACKANCFSDQRPGVRRAQPDEGHDRQSVPGGRRRDSARAPAGLTTRPRVVQEDGSACHYTKIVAASPSFSAV